MKLSLGSTLVSLTSLAAVAWLCVIDSPRAVAAAALATPSASCTTYCTGGTSTNGCVATMSCAGVPSLSAGSGFWLTTSNLEGQKQALMRYTLSGRIATPWAASSTSFVCIKAPSQKMGPVQNSGGTANACDGSISVDFIAWSVGHPWALGQPLAAGQVIDVQTIYKDPPAPKTTNWSDALEFTLLP
ncbi:MAG: hypothetical protein IT454_05675 [Planctomycetes bacterium]|nr:hypothetical protein [Planctomycetota bacterium]